MIMQKIVFSINKILKRSDLIEELKSKYGLQSTKSGLQIKKLTTLSGSKKYTRYGAGIKDQELPEYTYFSDIVIMLSKLYYNNTLSIRMKSGRLVDGFENAKVSNFFVDIIVNMCADKDVSNLLKDLNVDEKNLMNRLSIQAKLHKIYITKTN
jgi:hypothetical protein